jgi:NAD(P)-dependent dehydrogenase (short-subunit alcohol dehydrogenase family)
MSDLIAMSRVTFFGSRKKRGVDFDMSRDIPPLGGKTILITGGAGGLGKQTVIELARHDPAHIYIADLPSADNGAANISAIRELVPNAVVSFIEVDLGSFESIKNAAAKFSAAETRLDICILNAGVMPVKAGTTKEGYEIDFGINYLGHVLLTKLLLPTMLSTAALPNTSVRLVVVASEGHALAPRGGIIFDKLKSDGSHLVSMKILTPSQQACHLYKRR